jgi:hypothetical protein
MTVLSSSTARTLMGEAMDARALNYRQAQALINDTPEVDSIAEHLAALVAQGVSPSKVRDLFALTVEVFESNKAEGGLEMSLCGSLDDIAACLYDMERNHGGTGARTVRELGRDLRWALPVVYEPGGHAAATVVAAGALIAEIVDSTPADQLFTESVRKELRNTNYGRLLEQHAARHNAEGREGMVA